MNTKPHTLTKEIVLKIAQENNLKVDFHAGAGKFRDVYLGCGDSYASLTKLKQELVTKYNYNYAKISHVNNKEHPDYPKPFLELPSFWWE